MPGSKGLYAWEDGLVTGHCTLHAGRWSLAARRRSRSQTKSISHATLARGRRWRSDLAAMRRRCLRQECSWIMQDLSQRAHREHKSRCDPPADGSHQGAAIARADWRGTGHLTVTR